MNIIKNVLLIFIFLLVFIIIGIPGMESNNLINTKLYLFGGIMIFQLLLKSMYKLRYKCKISLKSILSDSIITGMSCVIGYSIFSDLITMENTKNIIIPYIENNTRSKAFVIATIITGFILCTKIIELIIWTKNDECETE